MAGLRSVLAGVISAGGAFVASLCCLLPLAILLLGLGTGAFMATTMRYTTIFVPIGVLSVAAGFYLHVRERCRCAQEGCRMAGGAWNLAILAASAVVVVAAAFLSLFPGLSADLLMRLTADQPGSASHTMDMPMGSAR